MAATAPSSPSPRRVSSFQETMATLAPSSPSSLPPASAMLFASSPMFPAIKELEDLPLLTTPGGHRNLELRSTEELPLSTRAAKQVLQRAGRRLLASKRSKRRISTFAQDQTKRLKGNVHEERSAKQEQDRGGPEKQQLRGSHEEGLAKEEEDQGTCLERRKGTMEEEIQDLKELVISSTSHLRTQIQDLQKQNSTLEASYCKLKERVTALEAHNVDLYHPLHTTRSLAILNLINATLRTVDQIVHNIIRNWQSANDGSAKRLLASLQKPIGPWQNLLNLSYTQLWWFCYNQTEYDSSTSLQKFFKSKLSCEVPSPPPSDRTFEPRCTQELRSLAENTIKPMLLEPCEKQISTILGFPDGFPKLRDLLGCYIAILKHLRNKGAHIFELMFNFDAPRWSPSEPKDANIFLINENLSFESLTELDRVLNDILGQGVDGFADLQVLHPLVQAIARRAREMCNIDMHRPADWDISSDALYWYSPCGEFGLDRRSGLMWAWDPHTREWVEHAT